MSTDNQDKTVFRQSSTAQSGHADATIIRPSPGRRGMQTQVPGSSQATNYRSTSSMPDDRKQAESRIDYGQSYTTFTTRYGLNPLVNSASMLIAVFYKTRQSVSHSNVGGLHQQLVNAIRNFEASARAHNIRPETVISARYILCASLDEAVLNTPWGADSAWTQRTLLSLFHNETNGGEKFFQILDRMKMYPAENVDILELMYILLSLGFEGKYRVISRGRDAIEQIRDELYRVIRTYRGEYERALSPSWQGLGKIRNTLSSYVPMWVMASIVAGVLVMSYTGFRYWLHHATENVASQLNTIAAPVNSGLRSDNASLKQ